MGPRSLTPTKYAGRKTRTARGTTLGAGHQSQAVNSVQSASFQIPNLDEKKTYKTKVRVGVSLGGLTRYAESDVLVFTVPLELGKPTLSVSDTGSGCLELHRTDRGDVQFV